MKTWHQIWAGMDLEERESAASALWKSEGSEKDQEEAFEFLAETLRFRSKKMRRLPESKRTRYLARAKAPPVPVIQAALRDLHFASRCPMMATFLGDLAIPHDGCEIEEGWMPEKPISVERFQQAIGALAKAHDPEDVRLYVDCLLAQSPELWGGLASVEIVGEGRSVASDEQRVPEEDEPSLEDTALRGADAAFRAGRRFDTLDRVVINAIVSSVGDIEGALDEDQVRDLAETLTHLNQDRTSSFFHLGFLDVLQDHPLQLDAAELNSERRGWYLSGALTGHVRRDCYDQASELVRSVPDAFRAAGHGEHDSASLVVPLLIDLSEHSVDSTYTLEYIDAAGLALAGPGSLSRLVDQTSLYIGTQRAEEAARILDRVEGAVAILDGAGQPLPWDFIRVIRRRRAHCHRLLGHFDAARALLQEILDEGAGGHSGMVLTDLGLLDCGLSALEDVKLPPEESDMKAVVNALEPGVERFKDAIACTNAWGAHGEFCMGVLCLADGRAEDARPLLERAVAEMQQCATTYTRGGILGRARLYLAWCLAESGTPTLAERIQRLTEQAANEIDLESPYLVAGILEDLSLVDGQRAGELASSLMGRFQGEILDAIRGAQLLRSLPEARVALLKRAQTRTRTPTERFEDAKRLLAASRRAGDEDMSLRALDELEDLSAVGPEAEDFLAVLNDPDLVSGLWDTVEIEYAKARVHESRGSTQLAAGVLAGIGHRLATEGEPHCMAEAADILERIRGYGVEPDPALVARMEAANGKDESVAGGDVSGTVFFLGGNETQAQYDEAIQDWVAETWPSVTLTLEHPGWSSNWGRQMATWEGRIRAADAIVLMRFVRTLLGRTVRKTCSDANVPWVACTGHGRDAMKRAIARAVALLPSSPPGEGGATPC